MSEVVVVTCNQCAETSPLVVANILRTEVGIRDAYGKPRSRLPRLFSERASSWSCSVDLRCSYDTSDAAAVNWMAL